MIRQLLKTAVACLTFPAVLLGFRSLVADLDVLEGRLIVMDARLVNLEKLIGIDMEKSPDGTKPHPRA